MSDWEYSDDECPKCGATLAYRPCNPCDRNGYWVDEDSDPDWPDSGRCDVCNGKGYEEWCRECGWDVTYGQFLSPQYEAEWLAKQEAL